MDYFEKIKSFSWSIIKGKCAYKIIDKSFIEYGETVIPIDIREYFEIDKFTHGDKVDISLLYNNEQYEGQITFETNFNRCKLKIDKELRKIIYDKILELNCTQDKNCLKVVFLKQDENKYLVKIIMEL